MTTESSLRSDPEACRVTADQVTGAAVGEQFIKSRPRKSTHFPLKPTSETVFANGLKQAETIHGSIVRPLYLMGFAA